MKTPNSVSSEPGAGQYGSRCDGISCLKTLKMSEEIKVMQRGGDMAKELATTNGAIGMTTTTVAEQSGGKIKALFFLMALLSQQRMWWQEGIV
jgi:hypothetical protein